MLFNIIMVILMVGSLAGMFFMLKKKADMPSAKPAGIGFFILLIITSYLFISNMMKTEGYTYISELKHYKKAETFVLCSELAKQMPGAKVLLIVQEDDIALTDENQKAQIEGIKEGFGDTVTDIKTVNPPRNLDAKIIEMADGLKVVESTFWRAKEFNQLIATNRDRDLIITLVRLPEDLDNINILNNAKDKPKFVFPFNIFSGDMPPDMMFPFVNAGKMPAMVLQNPEFESKDNDPPPSDLKASFDKRFILIKKDNMEQIIKKYPKDAFSKINTYY